MGCKDLLCKNNHWIQLIQQRDLVNSVLILTSMEIKAFLKRWETTSFSRRTLFTKLSPSNQSHVSSDIKTLRNTTSIWRGSSFICKGCQQVSLHSDADVHVRLTNMQPPVVYQSTSYQSSIKPFSLLCT